MSAPSSFAAIMRLHDLADRGFTIVSIADEFGGPVTIEELQQTVDEDRSARRAKQG